MRRKFVRTTHPGDGFRPIYHPKGLPDAATLCEPHTGHAEYVAKLEAAKVDFVREGWSPREDAETLRPCASLADFR